MNIINILICILIALIVIIFLAWKIKKDGLRKIIIKFIVYAENEFQQGENLDKFNYVFKRIYNLLPSVLKLFITRKMIENLIQKVFNEIKIALNYKRNGGK